MLALFLMCLSHILFGEGISKELDLLDASIHYKIITQSGSWFAYEDSKIAQGRDQVLQYLKTPAIFEKIYKQVISCIEAEQRDIPVIAEAFDKQSDNLELK